MGPDGAAKDGWARPGCLCRACDSTNVRMSFDGYGTQEEQVERLSLGSLSRNYDKWEEQIARFEEDHAGVTT